MAHAAYVFNPLAYARKLENAGMKRELAEVQAQLQFEFVTSVKDYLASQRVEIINFKNTLTERDYFQ